MKNLKLLSILLLLSIFSFSCSESDSDPGPSVSLIGKWDIKVYRVFEDGKLSETIVSSNTNFMEFTSKGEVIFTDRIQDGDFEIGKYVQISNTKLLMGELDREYQEYTITIKNKNELKLTQTSGFPFDQFEFEIKRI